MGLVAQRRRCYRCNSLWSVARFVRGNHLICSSCPKPQLILTFPRHRINVVFGGFVTSVQNYTTGGSKAEFQDAINRYALYFVYLAIARFVLLVLLVWLAPRVLASIPDEVQMNLKMIFLAFAGYMFVVFGF